MAPRSRAARCPRRGSDRRPRGNTRRRTASRSPVCKAEIKSGKVTYRIVGMPDRGFPKVTYHREATYATVESAVLREMIARTLFSICNDEAWAVNCCGVEVAWIDDGTGTRRLVRSVVP